MLLCLILRKDFALLGGESALRRLTHALAMHQTCLRDNARGVAHPVFTTYILGVVVMQTLFVRLIGQESPVAVAASTHLMLALSVPLRRRVQDSIDRRSFRRK